MPPIRLPEPWCLFRQRETLSEFFDEQIGCRRSIRPPPFTDRANLRVGLRRRDDGNAHCWRRNLSMTAEPGWTLPASTDSSERLNAS